MHRTILRRVRCAAHLGATSHEITAAVHYVHFELTAHQVELFGRLPVALVVDHPDYVFERALDDDNLAELGRDLRG